MNVGIGFGLGVMVWGLGIPMFSNLGPTRAIAPSPSLQLAQGAAPPQYLSFATFAGLFTIAPSGGDRQPLPNPTSGNVQALAWSPDHRHLGAVTGYSQVEIYTPAQQSWQSVFESSCFRPPDLQLKWTLDSQTLLLRELCQAPASGLPGSLKVYVSRDRETSFLPLSLPDDLQSDVYFSPDGSQVAFVKGDHIYRQATTLGAQPVQLTLEPGTYSSGGSPLVWSPDGRQIAFYEGTYPFQRIYVMAADRGQNRRLLTPDPNHQIYRSRLLWSPDGQYLAYYQPFDPPYSNQETIELIQVATGETRQIARPGFYHALSWAPNSRQLVLSSGNYFDPQALFLYDLETEEFTPLTADSLTQILDVQWSADSQWIAFIAQPATAEMGNQQLYTVRSDGSDFQAITASTEYAYPFTWVPSAP